MTYDDVSTHLVRRFPVEICNLSCVRTHKTKKVLDFLPVLQLSVKQWLDGNKVLYTEATTDNGGNKLLRYQMLHTYCYQSRITCIAFYFLKEIC